MNNNDLLRQLRYALNIDGKAMAEIFRQAGHEIGPVEALRYLKKEGDAGFVACSDEVMGYFLDGLIACKRGPTEHVSPPVESLSNNLVLRKLRIALAFNDNDMINILKQADVVISKSQLSSMFRAPDHRNYKECGDQFLRNFVRGLTLGYRKRDLSTIETKP